MSLKDPDASIEKQFYSIGEVAEILSENTSLVRFWVNELKIFKLQTNKKGNRLFTKSDIEKLQNIHHLVKAKGFTLAGAKQAIKDKEKMLPEDKTAILNKLKDLKIWLLKLKNELND